MAEDQTGAACSTDQPMTLGDRLRETREGPGDADYIVDEHVLDIQEVRGEAGRGPVHPRPVAFVLSFVNLTYRVKTSKKTFARRRKERLATNPVNDAAEQQIGADSGATRKLLDTISGEVEEGQMLAVMGASGSGKSTLIDALANRIEPRSLEGSITLNGEALDSRTFKAISAYVMQDDLLFPMLTVEETLSFAAEFRLPRSLSAAKKKERVQTLIDQLGLLRAAHTIIGDEGRRGVSGGERRRVSIGADIIHDPILLFLDEPTSGLDSTCAFMVVKVLQRIAQSGSIVIMSIHQPSYRIVGVLDRLIFLARGQMVYNGLPSWLPAYLSDFGRPVPENENWTEFFLDVVRELEGSPTGTGPLVEFNNTWQSSRFCQRRTGSGGGTVSLKDAISASIARGKLVSGGATGAATDSTTALTVQKFANPFWAEVVVLIKRSLINMLRRPELFLMRLGAVIVTGAILATLFWRLPYTPKGVHERMSFAAFSMSTMFYTCADALPVFIQERYIFMRETAYNAYRRFSYVVANAAVSFPFLVILSISFAATTFFAIGLAGGGSAFLFYFLIILASFWAGSSFVTFVSAILSQVILAYVVVVAVLSYFVLFSGFFINRDQIPNYWIWLYYVSMIRYPYEAVLYNEFQNAGQCFTRGVQLFDGSPLAALPASEQEKALAAISAALKLDLTSQTCMATGPDVLRRQGVTQLGKWEDLMVTIAWGFFFRVLFYFSLLLGSKNKRK